MPIGVVFNTLAVVIGGIIGNAAGHKLKDDFKDNLSMVFGSCSMAMGISSIVLMKNMPAVIFSIVIGTAIGLAVRFGDIVARLGMLMEKIISKVIGKKEKKMPKEEFNQALLTIIVLFCASGTGIYGSIVSGMSGDHSILIAKAILDLFTSLIFACKLGLVVSFIAVPQCLICLLLFVCGGLIYPLTTPAMIDDFKAVGGIILLATGFRMIHVKMFPIADMLPAMVIVMPISYLWAEYIVPVLH